MEILVIFGLLVLAAIIFSPKTPKTRPQLHFKQEVKTEPITITHQEFRELLELQQENEPFNFSCNSRGDVWPTPGPGRSHKNRRDYIPRGAYPKLDRIVHLVIRESYKGGRFYLTAYGVHLSRNRTQIVEFVFLD